MEGVLARLSSGRPNTYIDQKGLGRTCEPDRRDYRPILRNTLEPRFRRLDRHFHLEMRAKRQVESNVLHGPSVGNRQRHGHRHVGNEPAGQQNVTEPFACPNGQNLLRRRSRA